MRSEKILGVLGMSFSEWSEVKLGEIINLNYGKGLSATKRNPGNIPVYSSAGITGWHDKALIKKNGIIVGRKGTVGTVYYSETPFYCIDTAYYLTEDDTKEDLKYLYYLLNHLPLKKLNTDSAVPGLNRDNAYSQVFILPPIQEQKSIAHILSTLDDKIEVNSQINRTLENMAQAIFKQWFVDFEFPNEDGEPYKSSGGEMIESELGMIPKGWEVVKLNSVVDICYGKNLPTKNLLSDGYPVFGGNGQIGFYSEYLYEKSQVLIACRGAASGKVIISLPYSFVTNNSLVLEQNGTSVTHEYLKQFCLENEFYNYATGSAQPQITIANLANANILIPQRDLMNMFSLIRNSIDHEVLSLFNENNKLVAIRDALLPKLMSGEIRVPLDEEGDAS
jgi:type I restriction enzyme S subunit